jgi:DNA-binding transcriptional MerR regulator
VSERTSYSISELGDAAGVSRRTVRFYVQRGLLPPPEGLGRSACYTGRHLARLLQIKAWQEQGVPLEEIRARVSDAGQTTRRPAPRVPYDEPRLRAFHERAHAPGTAWFRQPLVAGFELHVGGGRPPLTAHQLAALAAELARILEREEERE